MITVNSLSSGRSSSYMAVHYPTDVNIFACVCIDYQDAAPKDPAVLKYCLEKLQGNFIASAEDEKSLKIMMHLEQLIGKEIVWVRGKSFDQIIDEAGCLPTWARRFCTTEMKILPIFEYIYFKYGLVKENIGFRYDEAHRAFKKERKEPRYTREAGTMKVKSEDILKPGVVLEAKKIDFNDPRVIEIVNAHKRGMQELKKLTEWTQEKQDNLRRIITI